MGPYKRATRATLQPISLWGKAARPRFRELRPALGPHFPMSCSQSVGWDPCAVADDRRSTERAPCVHLAGQPDNCRQAAKSIASSVLWVDHAVGPHRVGHSPDTATECTPPSPNNRPECSALDKASPGRGPERIYLLARFRQVQAASGIFRTSRGRIAAAAQVALTPMNVLLTRSIAFWTALDLHSLLNQQLFH